MKMSPLNYRKISHLDGVNIGSRLFMVGYGRMG